MIIVFTESFKIFGWNGYNARAIKGVSGSHNGPMYLAEGFAEAGHTVYFVALNKTIEPLEYKGVKYINYDEFERQEHCDLIVTTNNIQDLIILNKIGHYHRLAMIMHNELFNDDAKHMHDFNPFFRNVNDRFHMIYLSQNAKDNILFMQNFLIPCNNHILPNSLDLSEIVPYDAAKKEDLFVFFPVMERGYGMVRDVLEHFPDFKLVMNTYNDKNKEFLTINSQTQFTEDSSKIKVYDALSRGKYFVYSLVNSEEINANYSKGAIHYDTFAYVVLEALLHGVVVIAPRMAVFVEIYGDAICYVDTDDLIPAHFLSRWKQNNENFGKPILDRYVETIQRLEANPDIRQQYIEKGLEVGKQFCHQKVAGRFLEALFP